MTAVAAVKALAKVVLSVYHPPNVYPASVGSAGKVIDVPVGILAIGFSPLPP